MTIQMKLYYWLSRMDMKLGKWITLFHYMKKEQTKTYGKCGTTSRKSLFQSLSKRQKKDVLLNELVQIQLTVLLMHVQHGYCMTVHVAMEKTLSLHKTFLKTQMRMVGLQLEMN